MDEKIKETEEAFASETEQGKFLAKLEIVMLPNGDIGLRTTTSNKAVCKALLAGAAEVLDQPQKQQIVVPRMGFMPGGKITGRG